LEFEILNLVFVIEAENEMELEMPSKMQIGTAKICRSEKELRKHKMQTIFLPPPHRISTITFEQHEL
jgi:hypothetical protein